MTGGTSIFLRARPRRAGAPPALTVIAPRREGRSADALVGALEAQADARLLPGQVEVLTDGARDGPAVNGRAAVCNALAQRARGSWLLFLDADMRPVSDDFLERWLSIIARVSPWVAFGPVSSGSESDAPDTSLQRAIERVNVARLNHARAAREALTSNLLVHRDIFALAPFSEAFADAGREDSEWAARAGRRAPIFHVEGPAARAERVDDDTLLARYREAVFDVARLARAQPDAVRALPVYRAAQLFARAPGLSRLRPLLAHAARDPDQVTPPRLRALAARLWRASWYGEALR